MGDSFYEFLQPLISQQFNLCSPLASSNQSVGDIVSLFNTFFVYLYNNDWNIDERLLIHNGLTLLLVTLKYLLLQKIVCSSSSVNLAGQMDPILNSLLIVLHERNQMESRRFYH